MDISERNKKIHQAVKSVMCVVNIVVGCYVGKVYGVGAGWFAALSLCYLNAIKITLEAFYLEDQEAKTRE